MMTRLDSGADHGEVDVPEGSRVDAVHQDPRREAGDVVHGEEVVEAQGPAQLGPREEVQGIRIHHPAHDRVRIGGGASAQLGHGNSSWR